jgi:hypothetical protein
MIARSRRVTTLMLAASLLAAAAEAHADAAAPDSEEPFSCPAVPDDEADRVALARRLFEDGDRREAGHPEAALVRYRCAEAIAVRPAIELRIGIVAERLDRLDVAIEAYEQYLRLAGNEAPDRVDVERRTQQLRARAHPPTLAPPPTGPTSTGPTSTGPTPAGLRPAEHATSAGRWIGWALIGVGAAMAAAGGVFLIDAKLKSDAALGVPVGTPWKSAGASGTYDAAKTEQTVGVVGLAVGAVAAGAGIVLLMTGSASGEPRAASTPVGALGVVTLRF